MRPSAKRPSSGDVFTGANFGKAELRRGLAVGLAITVTIVLMFMGREALAFGRGKAPGPAFSPARPAFADPQGPRARGWGSRGQQPLRTEMALNAIDMLRLKRLAQELRLNNEQRRIVRDAYAKEVETKRSLLRERAQILQKMKQLMLAPESADLPRMEPEMRDLVSEFRQVERKIAEVEWATQDEVLEHLAPPQRVRCILFNERFDKELRVRLGAFWQRKYNVPPPPPQADVPE